MAAAGRRVERRGPRFTAGTAVLLVVALIGAYVLRNVFVAAHRVIGWGVAAAVVAMLIEPPVTWLSRFVPKVVAVLVAGLGIAAVAGVLVYGVFDDLQSESRILGRRGPAAAARLEARDDRVGAVATDLRLSERADAAFEALEERFVADPSQLAEAAVGTVPSYLVSFVLTIFFVLSGKKIFEGAIDQVGDPARRRRLEHVVVDGVRRARGYLWWSLLQGFVVGGATFLYADVTELTAPSVLALVAGVAATIPYIGIIVGSVPTVMLAAGFDSVGVGAGLLVVAIAAQAVEALVVRRVVDRRTLHVGPAVPVIVGSIGLEIYRIGGALYGVALAVVLLAIADAAATEVDEPLPTPNEDWEGGTGPPAVPRPEAGAATA